MNLSGYNNVLHAQSILCGFWSDLYSITCHAQDPFVMHRGTRRSSVTKTVSAR